MTDLSPNKQALLKIRELKQQIVELQRQQPVTFEPIAIVSMACRFPRRSSTPESFWRSLIDQTDEVTEIPDDRWDMDAFYDDDPDVPGKMYARHGVFLDNIDLMDPEFFGISPREATWVDPQQRLLMEVGWEAIERAGWRPEQIGESTGIFVGWMHNDYQNEASDSFLNLNPYIATGAAGSFLCGRLAYYLGLQGPSVAVDTACSSSLVALHLACQSLQTHDCDHALVGGVNVICSPTTNILTCKLKALSPSGRSRAFDAAADGYLRGEGCGVVTVRRLPDAERDGDPILGVISGSAIGHNGFSSGLTAPNPKAQEKVIRQALQRAQLSPHEIGYLEAHGTGTELGDPIEMSAAAAALTSGRSADNPLLVGSVKTNIGHLEAAAGMAGLIKVLLSLQNNRIPGQLNFDTPNPHIDWDRTPARVLTESTPWPNPDHRIAGVSAFGMSGTNAHVVVGGRPDKRSRGTLKKGLDVALSRSVNEQTENRPDEAERRSGNHGRPELITISAKSEEALLTLAERYKQYLADNPSLNLSDVAYTSNIHRSHFEHRAALTAHNRDDAIQALQSLAGNRPSAAVAHATSRRPAKVAWQFTGQGSQYVGMARALYDSEPIFRQAIDHCDHLLRGWRGEALVDVLFQEQNRIDHTSWTQPAIFAVQMGLARLLMHRGLLPDVVFGHSVGQYAAACVAGIMSWDDGLKLIAERGRLIGELPSGGRMLAVFAPLNTVETELTAEKDADSISVAAMNGTHIVLSGEESAVTAMEMRFAERNIRCKALVTSHAFHSSLMDPALQPFREFADTIEFRPAQIPLICNVSGKVPGAGRVLDGQYWADHIRAAVKFSDCVEAAQDVDCELLLELGPQSVLTRMAAANWKSGTDRLFSCLHRDADDAQSLLQAIGKLYAHGVTPNFAAMYDGRIREQVLLPTYPFQRRRFWGPDKPRAFHAEYHTAHPLLGSKVSLAGVANETRYEGFIEPDSPRWLPDHEVMGHVVLPGAAFVEMAIAAAKSVNANAVADIVFEQPLRPDSRTAVQTVIRSSDDQFTTMQTFSAVADGTEWTRHFTAAIVSNTAGRPGRIDLASLKATCGEPASVADFYQKMQDVGLNYGPKFQTITSLQSSETEVLAHLQTNGDIRSFTIPPTLLDGALHSLAVGLLRADDGNLFLPVGIGRVECFGTVDDTVWCHARWTQNAGNVRTADLALFTDSGDVVATLVGVKVQQVSRAALRQMSGTGAERLLYEIEWQSYRLPASGTSSKTWLIVSSGDSSLSESLAAELIGNGHSIIEAQLMECGQAEFVSRNALASDSDSDDVEQTGASSRRLMLDGSQAEHWDAAFEKLVTEEAAFIPNGIVWVFEDVADSDAAMKTHCEGLLKLMQTLQRRDIRSIECGLQLVTHDAVNIAAGAGCNAQQSKYWGFGRVIGAEQPTYRCRLIDVASADNLESAAKAVIEILLTETHDSQLAIRDSQFFVPRMKQIGRRRDSQSGFQVNSDASYLITGGLGVLGRQAAKWLADSGARQVVLVSRRFPDEATQEFLNQITEDGCDVVVHPADLGVRNDVQAIFQRFGADLKPLAGVIHAAGTLDDAVIGEQTWDRFKKVLSPKINGARLLDELTRSLSLDFFVLYSSVASVLGSPGQSNYATGNAFLDGLAWQRRAQGLPATSINWGPWTEGMADNERIIRRLSLQGITPLAVAEAHAAMEHILAADVVQATVIDVDWRRMRMGFGGDAPAMLERLTPARQKSQMGDSAFVGQLKRLRGKAQKDLLITTVQEMLQEVLSTPDAPDIDRPLIETGLDSLMAVEFSTQLQMMLGEQFAIGPTMLFDHPTIDAIADHVLKMLASEADVAVPASAAPIAKQNASESRGRESVAIVGMSCRFPGAKDLNEFWENLLNGVDSVCEIPSDRWDTDRFYSADREPGRMYTKEGGFLEDIADFDAAFFNISDQEACWIDPQHRMLLENSYRALEHAGISPYPLADSNVGVFMGIMGQDYAFLPHLDDEEVIQAFQGAGLSHSAGVGRISYVFGFEGPSIAVDTASSSSLVALYQAVRNLQDGNCNMALAGGVNAILAPVNSLLMSKSGLLSPDGRCKSFSADADGFGRGEGCGVVVLKRLSDAKRDGDTVLAVVRGGAVVHNGFTGGITSPSGKAQARVISAALQDARIAPAQVQYLEAHGTGTEFGDPMELAAASSVYGKGRKRDQPLLVGSVKANISHLEAAGGISGLIKTVLSLHHGVIPPQAHFASPSPHIPWKRMPVRMVTETTPWPETEERIAGVTALGLVGTNAHIILSREVLSMAGADDASPETNECEPKNASAGSELLMLSARSEQALTEVVRSYGRFLQDHAELTLADVCYTAATGRRHYEHRLAITVASVQDAEAKLKAFNGTANMVGVASDEYSIGTVSRTSKTAWIFRGEQSSGTAARELFVCERAFRKLIVEFDDHLSRRGVNHINLEHWLNCEPASNGAPEPPAAVQIFVLQAGVAAVFRSWGVDPDVVAGFGVGQYSAACVAGCLCFKDALELVVKREEALMTRDDTALNTFESFADQFNFYPPHMPLVCSLSGSVVPVHTSLGGSYWREHVVAQPNVSRSLKTLAAQNCDLAIHVTPTPAEPLMIPEGMSEVMSALRAERFAGDSLKSVLGQLYVRGATFRQDGPYEGRNVQRTQLPCYPFQKKRYWITEVAQYLEAETDAEQLATLT